MADSSGCLIESQVDWLTVSAHGQDAAQAMLDYAHHLSRSEQERGNRRRPWRLMGYEGYHVGAVQYGQRDQGATILRLIGDVAERELGNALSLADGVTRVDLAATWRCDPPDPYLGRNQYALAAMFHESHPRSARPWFTGDADGGYTCYLGKRESDRFLRVYNKEAECIATEDHTGAERYRGCWRFELEAKAAMAESLARVVEEREDRADYVAAYLVSFLDAHGMQAPFVAGQPVALLRGFRRRSDEESRIRHLARNVRPTIDWLRDQGQLERALDALGLSGSDQTLT